MEGIILAFLAASLGGLFTELTPLWFDWPAVLLAVFTCFAHLELENDKSRRAVLRELNSARTPYHDWLGRWLVWARRKLTPPTVAEGRGLTVLAAPDRVAARRTAKSAFGWTLLDFALLLAVAYPVLFMIGQWLVPGGAGRLGAAIVLPPWEHWSEPAATIGVIASLLFLARLEKRLTARPRVFVLRFAAGRSWLPVLLALAVVGAVAGAGGFAFRAASAGAGPDGTAFVFTSTVALTLTLPLAFTFAGAFAAAYAFTLAFVFTYAVALVFAAAVAGAGAIAVGAAFGVAIAFTVAAAAAVAFAVAIQIRNGHAATGYLTLFGLVAAANIALLSLVDVPLLPDQVRGGLLFIGVLPAVNGLFDFLSYGLTLTLLRAGYRLRGAWPVALGALDLLAALAVFTALGAALVAVVAGMNRLSEGTVFDLAPVFADLRAPVPEGMRWWQTARGEYIWLYLMLFSTLVPTLLHAGFATFSLFRWVPDRLRLPLVSAIERRGDGPYTEFAAKAGLGLARLASFALPALAFYAIWRAILGAAPLAGATYLQLFEALAIWLGEVSELGPGYLPEVWIEASAV